MTIGTWTFVIFIIFLSPTIIAFFCCLFFIKKKNYIKLSKKHVFAGFWYRLIAGVIDTVIVAVITFILALVPVIGWIFGIFVSWLYYAILQSSKKQSTFGMRAVDMKISDENYKKISFWRATGNYFVFPLSIMIVFIGLLMIAFTERKQGLHNFISRTLCIRDK